jgi:hypothetical protein
VPISRAVARGVDAALRASGGWRLRRMQENFVNSGKESAAFVRRVQSLKKTMKR